MAHQLQIGGAACCAAEDLSGTADEAAVYDKALSVEQVKLHHEAGRDAPR